jgi:hypothetical protein
LGKFEFKFKLEFEFELELEPRFEFEFKIKIEFEFKFKLELEFEHVVPSRLMTWPDRWAQADWWRDLVHATGATNMTGETVLTRLGVLDS